MGLGAAALVGVGVGVAQTGCQSRLMSGRCGVDRRLRVGPTVALTTLGIAMLTAGIVWAVRLGKSGRTYLALSPGAIRVSGTF